MRVASWGASDTSGFLLKSMQPSRSGTNERPAWSALRTTPASRVRAVSFSGGNNNYATVAYNAATGARLWAKRGNGPGNGLDIPTSVAVSPGGSTLYVTGSSRGRNRPVTA